jgi:hypothetical protein
MEFCKIGPRDEFFFLEGNILDKTWADILNADNSSDAERNLPQPI